MRNSTLSRAETPVPDRIHLPGEAKRRIGRLAASLIDDGQTILLNGGTTTLAVLPYLAGRRNLTVVTNNLLAPAGIPPTCARDVYLLGGNVRVNSGSRWARSSSPGPTAAARTGSRRTSR